MYYILYFLLPRIVILTAKKHGISKATISKMWFNSEDKIFWDNGFIVVYKTPDGMYFLPKTLTDKYKISDIKMIKSFLGTIDYAVHTEFNGNYDAVSRLCTDIIGVEVVDNRVAFNGRS